MTEPDRPPSDEKIESLLTAGLQTRPLDAQAMQRLYQRSAAEWRRTAPLATASRPSRVWLWGLAAAATLMVAFGVAWMALPVGETTPFGTVVRLEQGSGRVQAGLWHSHALDIGTVVQVGEVVVTHGAALISLPAGSLRLAADTRLRLVDANTAQLEQGLVYVDLPPGSHTAQPFQIVTRLGAVQHVGTQFEVLSNEQAVRIRVREGRIRLATSTRNTEAPAGTQLLVTAPDAVVRSDISTYGRDWLWVAALAPDYEIEGKPLIGFLEWASRELGRSVQFSDAHAREVADHTILHGSVKGREPLDALASVLATTSLRYELRDGAIWIESGRGI